MNIAARLSAGAFMAGPSNGICTDVAAEEHSSAVAFRQMTVMELIAYTEKLKALGETTGIAAALRQWIEANPDNPLLAAIYFNYSVTLDGLGDLAGAVDALRTAIRLDPDFCQPYINLGSLLERQGRHDQAVVEWLGLVEKFPTLTGKAVQYATMAMNQIGRVLQAAGKAAEAEEMLRRSLDIDPEQNEVAEHFAALRQRQCKWPSLLGSERVTTQRLLAMLPPLGMAYHTDDAMLQLARAYRYNKSPKRMPKPADLLNGTGGSREPGRKLRIGYVSSDLRAHAVGFAMTDVFETHDRDKFELFAYYGGHAWDDDTKLRIRSATDKWTDITSYDDNAAASCILADGIDILVDLNGYSRGERTKVFALRPAPIAINWFGFPATMGSPYHHYIIADDYIIPKASEIYYSETVLRLPCYQPNDRRRAVSQACPTRQDAGLPEGAFVYCCMNGAQKLTQLTLRRWADILAGVPNSVLWLLKGDDGANERLRQAVAERGVAPERLIFAETIANSDHLARYALADLFLDTLPYGAHTTASDALWMGVPVLTLSGQSFAARVSGSLLKAAGLEDMICTSADDYVATAVALGHDKARVGAMRQRLLAGRKTSLLFNTPLLVRSLEALYRQIWESFLRGERPVPDLRNLDLYHEIGVELDLGTSDRLDPDETRRRYQQKLAERATLAPVEFDARFWPSGSGYPVLPQAGAQRQPGTA